MNHRRWFVFLVFLILSRHALLPRRPKGLNRTSSVRPKRNALYSRLDAHPLEARLKIDPRLMKELLRANRC